jgi:hypothetical protein
MIVHLAMWLAMAALAATCGIQLNFPAALIAWAAFAVIACAGGALLIHRQPMGVATNGGLFGCGFVRWGFRAGRGKLMPAAAISCLIWLLLGGTIITSTQFTSHLPIIVAWTGDSLGLFYIVGVMLANRSGRVPASLIKIVLGLVGLIAGSACLWFQAGTDSARAIAVAVAGGPPLFVGVGYGFVLAMGMLSQRKHS